MSTECREIVAGLLVLALCLTVWGVWPSVSVWRVNRRLVREFRRQVDRWDAEQVAKARHPSSGRDSPPR